MLVQIQDKFEEAVKQRLEEARARDTELGTRAKALDERQSAAESRAIEVESMLWQAESVRLNALSASLETMRQDLDGRESAVVRDSVGLKEGRQQFESDQKDLLEFRRTVDERVADVEKAEHEAAAKAEDLARREAHIQPLEVDLTAREVAVSEKESDLQSLKAITEAAAREVAERAKSVEDRETALSENRVVLEEARGAFDIDRKEFQQRTAQDEDELRRRRADLDGQAKDVGEAQLRLAHDKETFETSRMEKNQAILSKEIELE